MVELRNEDQASFKKFLCMPPLMFDKLLARFGTQLTTEQFSFRKPLEPGMKLAVTLRHLASRNSYSSMKFGWRDPYITISVMFREVC